MIPALILGGMAATYLHKKFPRATEAVANGTLKAAGWAAKKAVQQVDNYFNPACQTVEVKRIEKKESP